MTKDGKPECCNDPHLFKPSFSFFFNIKKSIKRLNNNATIIIISLKKINKSRNEAKLKKWNYWKNCIFFII